MMKKCDTPHIYNGGSCIFCGEPEVTSDYGIKKNKKFVISGDLTAAGEYIRSEYRQELIEKVESLRIKETFVYDEVPTKPTEWMVQATNETVDRVLAILKGGSDDS